MDVNQQTVDFVMRKYRVHRLIHGHTHRPAEHQFEVNGTMAQRFVLAQWEQEGRVLVFSRRGYQIEPVTGG